MHGIRLQWHEKSHEICECHGTTFSFDCRVLRYVTPSQLKAFYYVPRLVQPNLVLDKGDKVTLKTYPATTDGMISSFQDRYEKVQHLEEALLKCALQDAPHFSM